MTRVLSVASECVPLVKTGGLADVAGAMHGALAPLGVELRTLLPGYPAVMEAVADGAVVQEFDGLFGGTARVLRGALGDHVLYALDAPHLYAREAGIYLGPDGRDWPDNPLRFAALSRAAALIAADGIEGWHPQVVHCHDWQAGLAPTYLRHLGAEARVGTLITLHNIAFQGLAPAELLPMLKLHASDFTPSGIEYYGKISALKAALVHADAISTVSPTYAQELMTPEFGMGLDGVIRSRAGDVTGILNGIDTALWTPPYDDLDGKAEHKAALREECGLPEADGPLCVVISRLTEQKGLDLLLDALPRLLDQGGQLAMLGSGGRRLEDAFRAAADRHDGVSVRIGYDEAFSRRLIAGGDAILVPSRFEPCGLTQLYGLRFGTVPLVALTGGLADTVINASPAALATGAATGIQFHPVTEQALSGALARLCALYKDRETWARIARNAMATPVSWEASAPSYAALYDRLTKSS